jgi:hypothetical protein
VIDAFDIEFAIMRERKNRAILVPRYTPRGWWECDVAELTEAGYFREYEIKTTRSDFRADKKKMQSFYTRENGSVLKFKHTALAAQDPKGPSQFFFVTPEGLITVEELPPWAGLIYVSKEGLGWPQERIIKHAPKLHREKRETMKDQMFKCGFYRAVHMWQQQYFRYADKRNAAAQRKHENRS